MAIYFTRVKYLLSVIGVATSIISASPSDPDITKVPQPYLEEHPGWVDLYKRTFELSFNNVNAAQAGTVFVPFFMDEAFNPNIFQWDTSFMMMFGRYSNGELPSIVSLENFYLNQYEDGWISRELKEDGTESYWPKDGTETNPDLKMRENCSINPPLFSWAEWSDYQISGDAERFNKVIVGKYRSATILDVLIDYYNWIKANRRWANGMYWSTSYANGMDNNPRLFYPNEVGASESAAGGVCDNLGAHWIDITAQQALNAYYIAKIAGEVGRTVEQATFEAEHADLVGVINSEMWDPVDKMYYDLNADKTFNKIATPASFWPLIARVATQGQAADLVTHILNPNEFWTTHHIPTVSASSPGYLPGGGYWNGAVWAPTLYETVKGLEAYGYYDVAKRVSINHIQNLYWVYVETNTLWENYHQESPKEGESAKPDFVGWTGVGPIACLIENVMGILAYGPADSLDWNLTLAEKHGLENFSFGDNTITLMAEDRLNTTAGTSVTITSNSPFTLHVTVGTNEYVEAVPAGTTVYQFGYVDPRVSAIQLIHKGIGSNGFGAANSEASRYQTFTATSSSQLAGVDVKVRRLNGYTQSGITVSLYATEGGVPVGNALAEEGIDAAEVDNFFSIVHTDLVYDNLEEGLQYAIALSQETLKDANYEWVNGEVAVSGEHFGKGSNGDWTKESNLGNGWMVVYVIDTTISLSSSESNVSSQWSSIGEESSDAAMSSGSKFSSVIAQEESSAPVASSDASTPLWYGANNAREFTQFVNTIGRRELAIEAPQATKIFSVYNVRGERVLVDENIVEGHAMLNGLPQGLLVVVFK